MPVEEWMGKETNGLTPSHAKHSMPVPDLCAPQDIYTQAQKSSLLTAQYLLGHAGVSVKRDMPAAE